MEKTYNPQSIESKWYETWESMPTKMQNVRISAS